MKRITMEDLAALTNTEAEIRGLPEATDHPAVPEVEPLPTEPPVRLDGEAGALIGKALAMGAIVIGPGGEVHMPEDMENFDDILDQPCGRPTLLVKDCRGEHRMCDTHGRPMQIMLQVERLRALVGADDLVMCTNCGKPVHECLTVEALDD